MDEELYTHSTHTTLAAWQTYAVRHLVAELMYYPNTRRMQEDLQGPDLQSLRDVLRSFISVFPSGIEIDRHPREVEYLIATGYVLMNRENKYVISNC